MAESSLFQTMVPHQPIDVMLLVENSQNMSLVWDDLRDRLLSRLMQMLKVANDPLPVSTTVWVLESQPLHTNSTALPRQYNDPHVALHDVRLNNLPENRLSYNKVDEAVNFLSSLKRPGEPRALHLIVVAASSPAACIDETGREIITDPSGFSLWYRLAHKLAQASIYCHMLIKSTSEDMTALTTLFEETLRSQSNMEDRVSFLPDSQFAIRLSMSPKGQFNPPPRPQRIPMPPRRNTFPLELGYISQYEDSYQPTRPVDMEGSPSLVSQLQQVHGLTKKKVYGAKPARQPFFKDDAGYAAGPPLATPAYSHDGSLPPSSGRAMTHSKADRIARLAQASPTLSAADSQGRYVPVGWGARRGSRLSSPEEVDGVISPTSVASFSEISPPTSYLSSNLSSPVSPVSVDDYYSIPTAGSMPPPPSAVNGGGPDPTWLQSSYAAQYSPPYYISPPNPGPPTYHEAAMYMGHNYAMQLPPSGPGPSGLALPPMVVGSANKRPPKTSSIEIPPPPGAEISAAPSHHHASSERRTGSSKTATSGASGSTSATHASSSTPPPPPAPPPPKASLPLTTKKTKASRPEDDEYIELDQEYVKEATDLFNAFFPNAENFPDSKPSGTNSFPTSSSSNSTSTSTPTIASSLTSGTSTNTTSTATLTSSPSSTSGAPSSSTVVTTPGGCGGNGGNKSTASPATSSPGRSSKSKASKTGPGSPSSKLKAKKTSGGIQKRRATTSGGSSSSKVCNNGSGLTVPPAPGPSASSASASGSSNSSSSSSPRFPSTPSSTTTPATVLPGSATVAGVGPPTTSGAVGSISGVAAASASSSDGSGVFPLHPPPPLPPPTSSFVPSVLGTGAGTAASGEGVGVPLGTLPVYNGPSTSGGVIPPPPPMPAPSAGQSNGYLQQNGAVHIFPPPPLPLPASTAPIPPGSSFQQPQYSPQMTGGEYHRYQQQQQLQSLPSVPPAVDAVTSLALHNHHLHLASISAGNGVPTGTSASSTYYAGSYPYHHHLAPGVVAATAPGGPAPTSSLTGWAG